MAFFRGVRVTISSLSPIKNRISIPAIIYFSSLAVLRSVKRTDERIAPAKIIVPPSLGTGWLCEDLSHGISNKFLALDNLLTAGMPNHVIKNARMNPDVKKK